MSERTDKIQLTPLTDSGAFIRIEGSEATDASKNISTQQGDGVFSGPKRKDSASAGWKLSRMVRNEQEITTKKVCWQSLLGDEGKATFTEIAAGTNMTYAAWVKVLSWPGSQTSGMAILGKNTSNFNGSALGMYDFGVASASFSAQCGSAQWTVDKATAEAWMLFVITKSGTTLTCYINAASQGTSSAGANCPAITTLGWGVQGQAFNYFTGMIDESLVFNRTLSQGDIDTLYAAGAGAYADLNSAPWNSGLLAAWHLDQDFQDISANANHMTGAGTYTWEIGKVEAPTDIALEYQVWVPYYVPDAVGVDCSGYTTQNDCQADDCTWGTGQCCQYTDASSCAAVSGCSWGYQNCNVIADQTACGNITGCSWGSQDCIAFTSQYECTPSGCSWSSGNSCSSFTQEQCTPSGCSWSSGSCSGYDQTTCGNTSGCSWTGFDCISKTDQYSCQYTSGCSWDGNCLSFSNSGDCSAHPPCSWGSNSCSSFDQWSCTPSGCSWVTCNSYSDSTNCGNAGCSWTYGGDCSSYGSDQSTCESGHSGCTWYSGQSCSGFQSWECGNYAGCSWVSCSGYGDEGSCTGAGCQWYGYCTGDYCSGTYNYCSGTWYYCSGSDHCNGSYDACSGTYCTGTYYQCEGNYAYCSGTYDYCSGSYYTCVGSFNTRCSGTFGACS